MTEKDKRQAIEDFFTTPKPVRSYTGPIIGVLILLANFIWFNNGIFLIIVGVAWALCMPIKGKVMNPKSDPEQSFSIVRFPSAKRRFQKITDFSTISKWFFEDLEEILKESYGALDLEPDNEASAVQTKSLYGPLFFQQKTGFSDDVILRRNLGDQENPAYMYSTWKVSIFHFTEYYVGAYKVNYNMIKDTTTMETVDEFFYRDIVSMQALTTSTNLTLETGTKMEHAKMFRLKASSGDAIDMVINSPELKVESTLDTRNDQNVKFIRTMLRNFKASQSE